MTTYPFNKHFKGFEKIEAVTRIFGEKTEDVLCNLRVEFTGGRGYMGVSDLDGHLIISAHYLKKGEIIDIYLDIIHELVHVKQFMEGKALFDRRYNYIERPTEVEAYRYVVEEARNLKLSEMRIFEHLKTEWLKTSDLKKLAKTLNVKAETTKKMKKIRVRPYRIQ